MKEKLDSQFCGKTIHLDEEETAWAGSGMDGGSGEEYM